MDDIAAREVCDAHAGEPAATPQAERPHGIDERRPHRAEDHPRREVHTTEHGTGENDDGDGSEHELEENQGRHRKGERRHARCGRRDYRLAGGKYGRCRQARRAEEWKPLRAERHIIIEQNPDHQDRSERVDRHEGGVDRPFLLDDAAVENR